MQNTFFLEIAILFLISILLYIFLFFPIITYLLSKISKDKIFPDGDYEPELTVLISAYNEEEYLEDCIISVLNSNYPIDKIKIIIGSDGSTDKTNEIGRMLQEKHKNINFYEFHRGGKNVLLNKLVPLTNTNIIFFLDADLRVLPDSIKNSIQYLGNESVGLTMSAINIINPDQTYSSGYHGESLYQKYETFLRKNESIIHSAVNIGTMHGIKRELFQNIANSRVCDDLFNLMSVLYSKKRAIFVDSSKVLEIRKKNSTNEFERRRRLVSCGLSTIEYFKGLLSPRYGIVSFFMWSHKLLRWVTPFIMIFLIVFNLFLSPVSVLFLPLVILQSILYFSAFIGWIIEKNNINFPPLKLALFFVNMNVGFLFGIFRYLSKQQNSIWSTSGLQNK
jgi:cellulose synthase/poly-beta-1,6-N-acetylglucosamine synthase-like glycosyltransferase